MGGPVLRQRSDVDNRQISQKDIQKGQSLAQGWPLIPVAMETADVFAGLVTEIRDDDLPGLFRDPSRDFKLNVGSLGRTATSCVYAPTLQNKSGSTEGLDHHTALPTHSMINC